MRDVKEKTSSAPKKPPVSAHALSRASSFSVPTTAGKTLSNTDMLLEWAKSVTRDYEEVNLTNWTRSWWDGMAYCAIIHYYYPDQMPYSQLKASNKTYNLDLAFRTAEVGSISPSKRQRNNNTNPSLPA